MIHSVITKSWDQDGMRLPGQTVTPGASVSGQSDGLFPFCVLRKAWFTGISWNQHRSSPLTFTSRCWLCWMAEYSDSLERITAFSLSTRLRQALYLFRDYVAIHCLAGTVFTRPPDPANWFCFIMACQHFAGYLKSGKFFFLVGGGLQRFTDTIWTN